MLILFVAIGLITFTSVLYGILSQVQLLAIIRNGRATAVDLAIYLGLDSLDELDQLRQEQPDLLRVVPGPPGTYEHVEFTFSSRRVKALRRRGPMSWIEGLSVRMVSVVLLLAALVLGHARAAGWVVLFAAVAVEALRWIVTRSQRGSRQEAADTEIGEPIYETNGDIPAEAVAVEESVESPQEEFGEPIYEEDDPGAYAEAIGEDDGESVGMAAPPLPTLQAFTTIVLLRHAWRPAEAPIVGGLRRAGQRDATGASARGGDPERVRIKCSDLIVNVVNHPTRVDAALLDFATGQSWHWPEAASATAGHAAHLTVATSFPPGASLPDIVRLHHRAHAAVSEFAPTIAVLWPSAGKLTPVDEIAGLARGESGLLESCVTFRAFADGKQGAGQIIDTAGLAAMGRPDVELHTTDAPTDEISAALTDLADRLFHGEPPPADGDTLDWPGLGRVSVHRQPSHFEPARDVLRIEPG